MTRNQYVGIIWLVFAIIYGIGSGLVQHTWFTLGGAGVIAIIAVTTPVWRQWLPRGPEG